MSLYRKPNRLFGTEVFICNETRNGSFTIPRYSSFSSAASKTPRSPGPEAKLQMEHTVYVLIAAIRNSHRTSSPLFLFHTIYNLINAELPVVKFVDVPTLWCFKKWHARVRIIGQYLMQQRFMFQYLTGLFQDVTNFPSATRREFRTDLGIRSAAR